MVIMRVRLSSEQAECILENLQGNHLCNSCEYDVDGNIIKGTECLTKIMIDKFQRIVDGDATRQGRRGGYSALFKRKLELGEAKREGIKMVYDGQIEDNIKAREKQTKRTES